MVKILGSALDLGLGAEFLTEAHDEVVKSLIEIDSTSLGEKKIEDGEYRKYLGNKQFVHLRIAVDYRLTALFADTP